MGKNRVKEEEKYKTPWRGIEPWYPLWKTGMISITPPLRGKREWKYLIQILQGKNTFKVLVNDTLHQKANLGSLACNRQECIGMPHQFGVSLQTWSSHSHSPKELGRTREAGNS